MLPQQSEWVEEFIRSLESLASWEIEPPRIKRRIASEQYDIHGDWWPPEYAAQVYFSRYGRHASRGPLLYDGKSVDGK